MALLGAGVAAGAFLRAGVYALGSVNRFREGGWRRAVYASSGLAGWPLFVGLGIAGGGAYLGVGWLALIGGGRAVSAEGSLVCPRRTR